MKSTGSTGRLRFGARARTWALVGAGLGLSVLIVAGLFAVRRGPRKAPNRGPTSTRLKFFPQIVLWAWERPEDLRTIDPARVGIAYLAATIYLRGDDVSVRPRLQPMQAPEGTAIMAVLRIELDRRSTPRLNATQRDRIADQAVKAAAGPTIRAIQIDFDAATSERGFYADVLGEIRRRLPSTPLSITALASWCINDDWIESLPVDEAVPMLFRMGVGDAEVKGYLRSGQDFSSGLAGGSLGVSADEPVGPLPRGRRVYVFSDTAWTPDSAARAIRMAASIINGGEMATGTRNQ